ncbi:MAG: diacylglycerol kinase [Flavobacteriaceae bacterium]|nr:MAG: diacylglycerol kinase [Flavobacteriaceae bacterium]
MNKFKNFVIGRIISVKYAAKGSWILITSEHSIMAQFIIAFAVSVLGFLFQITTQEWLFQIVAIALVIVAESLNTAIEKIADFIHPEYHKQIGVIKDVSAGAAFFAAIFAVIIGLIIYVPKFLQI